ncbi:MFS transporter [Corynebacterium phocae]|uniref:MFS transporter n=1 Tax=Corynebacterium phocae TaxID=161895 RepID=A0A1L7D5W7_9CORY|nr:MFS transporter [Corynebacterium phocae]APT93538.1 MFS transporter [Corynebacterium phocae]KAA8720622.1 MHS family MFS transporter [Corynebacterium phocae]
MAQTLTAEHRKVLGGSMVGTTIEWFDFFIYAQAAGLIFAAQFFEPLGKDNPTLGQTISWASLGISFLFRPLGAVIAGHLGDKMGRKPVLVVTLLGMGTATMLIGLLPTYETIGVLAPVLLIFLRILQGLSAGGEWGGAAMLAVEHAPPGRRGFFGSFPQIGVPLGMALATVFMLVLSGLLGKEGFEQWGWRVPFLSSVVLIFVGFMIRRMVEESPAFKEMQQLKKKETAPLSELFKNHTGTVIKCAGTFIGNNALGYFVIAYFISYGIKVVGYTRNEAFTVVLLAALAWLIATPLFGALSDTIGRKRLFLLGYAAMIIFSIPAWMLVDSGNVVLFGIAVATMGFLEGPTYAPQSALYAEMFPVHVRLSGTSIGYALGAVFGGAFAPMIASLIYDSTGSSMGIALYGIGLCAISFLAVSTIPGDIQDRDLSV